MPWGGGHSGNLFHTIISLENLFAAWREFRRGKRKKKDVQIFEFNLENNLFALHELLVTGAWEPDPYISFYIRDPKTRHIHKASVRDRVVHQALFRILYPIFDQYFIFDSYSSRVEKGTHRGVQRLARFIRECTVRYTFSAFALKCDIRKFFDSVDQEILLALIRRRVFDERTLWLIERIVRSFEFSSGKGLPLGNVTSQLFANIYLNELDQWMKHQLKMRFYLRYSDDFAMVDRKKEELTEAIPRIEQFLANHLKLQLHPKKVILRKVSQGIDFLGYVVLPHWIVLRTKTKKRIFRRIEQRKELFSINSYFGLLKHCSGKKIKAGILKRIV